MCGVTWYDYFQLCADTTPHFLKMWHDSGPVLTFLIVLSSVIHVWILLHLGTKDGISHLKLGWLRKDNSSSLAIKKGKSSSLARISKDFRFWVGVIAICGGLGMAYLNFLMKNRPYLLGLLSIDTLWMLTPYGISEIIRVLYIYWIGMWVWLVIELLIAIPVQSIDPYGYMKFTIVLNTGGSIAQKDDGATRKDHDSPPYEYESQQPIQFQHRYLYFSTDGKIVCASNTKLNDAEDTPIEIEFMPKTNANPSYYLIGMGTSDDEITFDGSSRSSQRIYRGDMFSVYGNNDDKPKSQFKLK